MQNPLVSFCATNVDPKFRPQDQTITAFELYCVQTTFIQQYSVNANQCWKYVDESVLLNEKLPAGIEYIDEDARSEDIDHDEDIGGSQVDGDGDGISNADIEADSGSGSGSGSVRDDEQQEQQEESVIDLTGEDIGGEEEESDQQGEEEDDQKQPNEEDVEVEEQPDLDEDGDESAPDGSESAPDGSGDEEREEEEQPLTTTATTTTDMSANDLLPPLVIHDDSDDDEQLSGNGRRRKSSDQNQTVDENAAIAVVDSDQQDKNIDDVDVDGDDDDDGESGGDVTKPSENDEPTEVKLEGEAQEQGVVTDKPQSTADVSNEDTITGDEDKTDSQTASPRRSGGVGSDSEFFDQSSFGLSLPKSVASDSTSHSMLSGVLTYEQLVANSSAGSGPTSSISRVNNRSPSRDDGRTASSIFDTDRDQPERADVAPAHDLPEPSQQPPKLDLPPPTHDNTSDIQPRRTTSTSDPHGWTTRSSSSSPPPAPVDSHMSESYDPVRRFPQIPQDFTAPFAEEGSRRAEPYSYAQIDGDRQVLSDDRQALLDDLPEPEPVSTAEEPPTKQQQASKAGGKKKEKKRKHEEEEISTVTTTPSDNVSVDSIENSASKSPKSSKSRKFSSKNSQKTPPKYKLLTRQNQNMLSEDRATTVKGSTADVSHTIVDPYVTNMVYPSAPNHQVLPMTHQVLASQDLWRDGDRVTSGRGDELQKPLTQSISHPPVTEAIRPLPISAPQAKPQSRRSHRTNQQRVKPTTTPPLVQSSSSSTSSSSSKKRDSKKAEAALLSRLEKMFQSHHNKIFRKLEAERIQQEAKEEERLSLLADQIVRSVSESLPKVIAETLPKLLDSSVKKDIQRNLIPAVNRHISNTLKGVPKAVAPALEKQIHKTISQQLHNELHGPGQGNGVVNEITANLLPPVKDTFSECFQRNLIPAVQSSTTNMLQQINGKLQEGLQQHYDSADSAHRQLSNRVDESNANHFNILQAIRGDVNSLLKVSDSLGEEVGKISQRIFEIEAQQREGSGSGTGRGSGRGTGRGTGNGSVKGEEEQKLEDQKEEEEETPEQLMEKFTKQTKEVWEIFKTRQDHNGAFSKALGYRYLPLVWWLCYTIESKESYTCEEMLTVYPPMLKGPEILSLIQQLGQNLKPDTAAQEDKDLQMWNIPLDKRLTWLKGAIMAVDISDETISSQFIPEIFGRVIQNLESQCGHLLTSKISYKLPAQERRTADNARLIRTYCQEIVRSIELEAQKQPPPTVPDEQRSMFSGFPSQQPPPSSPASAPQFRTDSPTKGRNVISQSALPLFTYFPPNPAIQQQSPQQVQQQIQPQQQQQVQQQQHVQPQQQQVQVEPPPPQQQQQGLTSQQRSMPKSQTYGVQHQQLQQQLPSSSSISSSMTGGLQGGLSSTFRNQQLFQGGESRDTLNLDVSAMGRNVSTGSGASSGWLKSQPQPQQQQPPQQQPSIYGSTQPQQQRGTSFAHYF